MNYLNKNKKIFKDGVINLTYKNGVPCIEIIAEEKNNPTNKNSKGYF